MTVSQINAVLDRSYSDPDFTDLLMTNPESALQGYELTPSEKATLVSKDEDSILRAAMREQSAKYMIVRFDAAE